MVRRVLTSFTLYPVTVMYTAGMLVACGIAAGWFSRNVGLMCLTFMVVLVVMVALTREVRIVHHLVNSQRDALLARIDDLVERLTDAGVALPDAEKEKERDTSG